MEGCSAASGILTFSQLRRHDCCRDCCYTTDSDSCLLSLGAIVTHRPPQAHHRSMRCSCNCELRFCYVCCSGPDCYCPCEAGRLSFLVSDTPPLFPCQACCYTCDVQTARCCDAGGCCTGCGCSGLNRIGGQCMFLSGLGGDDVSSAISQP